MIAALPPVEAATMTAVPAFELDVAAWDELKFHQTRLGTPSEDPDDYRRACELAHWINNQIAGWLLRTSMASPSFALPELAGTWSRRLVARLERPPHELDVTAAA